MIDINLLRNNIDEVESRLNSRGFKIDKKSFIGLENERRNLQVKVQELQESRNDLSKKIGVEKSKGNDVTEHMKSVGQTNDLLKVQNGALEEVQNKIQEFLLDIPNLAHESVPIGQSENDNEVIKEVGEKKEFSFKVKDHVDIGESLGLDFDLGVKLSGARFTSIRSGLASLHRALGQFMLDIQTQEHGYEECYTPYLVNYDSLKGTGQLPKFEEDLFITKKGG